jgi:hypothetical protein
LTTVPPRSTDQPRRGWTEGIQLPSSPGRKPARHDAQQPTRRHAQPAIASKPNQARPSPSKPSEAGARGHSRGTTATAEGRPRLDRRRHAVLAAELRSTTPPSHRCQGRSAAAARGQAPPPPSPPRLRPAGLLAAAGGRERGEGGRGRRWISPPVSPRVRRRGG